RASDLGVADGRGRAAAAAPRPLLVPPLAAGGPGGSPAGVALEGGRTALCHLSGRLRGGPSTPARAPRLSVHDRARLRLSPPAPLQSRLYVHADPTARPQPG